MAKQRRSVGLLLGLVTVAGALAPAAQQPADPAQALAREQLKVARQALQDLDVLYKGGQVDVFDARLSLWGRRQVEAIRDAGAPREEFLAALEAYVNRLKVLQSATETGLQKGLVSRLDVHDAKYRVLEAEMWLGREKAR